MRPGAGNPAQPSKPAYCETGRPYLRRTSGLIYLATAGFIAPTSSCLRNSDSRWRGLLLAQPNVVKAIESYRGTWRILLCLTKDRVSTLPNLSKHNMIVPVADIRAVKKH